MCVCLYFLITSVVKYAVIMVCEKCIFSFSVCNPSKGAYSTYSVHCPQSTETCLRDETVICFYPRF